MKPVFSLIGLLLLTVALHSQQDSLQYVKEVPGRWSAAKANEWYARQPWLVGANYIPATAINQIEMWQESTWDPATIDNELGWAAGIGMNTMRVYLHDLVWASDEKGLYKRMDTFLDICKKHGIRPWFVFFDDCHFPQASLGEQPLPVMGFHNSGWLNSPTRAVALRFAEGRASKKEVNNLQGYVQKTMEHFANDERILMWELYNEPGRGNNMEGNSAGSAIGDQSMKLVYASWLWARKANPSQPITSCTEGSLGNGNIAINRMNSDLLSIHNYGGAKRVKELIDKYKADGRPVMMTEWLARTNGSTVHAILPLLKEEKVAAINWGLVSGKTGTVWPWKSRNDANNQPINVVEQRAQGHVVKPGEEFPEPPIWFHDLFRVDGSSFNEKEIQLFRELTGKIQVDPKGSNGADTTLKGRYLSDIKASMQVQWPKNRTIHLLFHGHSVPAGYFVTPEVNSFSAYPLLTHQQLSVNYQHAVINVMNTAIGGEDAEKGAARFMEDVVSRKPDIVFIDYALNDRGMGLERAKASWEKMIQLALDHHIKVMLLTPTPDKREDLFDDSSPLAQHAAQIRKLAEKYQVGLIDSYAIFRKEVQKGIRLNDLMSQVNHPSLKGHLLVAHEICSWF